MAALKTVKFCCVGDGGVGKTALAMCYAQNRYDDEYIPTVFDNYTCQVMVDGKPLRVNIWDTAGQEDYGRLRPLSYPGTDCFILCFSLVSPTSFRNLDVWIEEVRHYAPQAHIVLVGCKSDLTKDRELLEKLNQKKLKPVSAEQAEQLAKRIGGSYLACSSKTGDNVHAVFEKAIQKAIEPKKPVKRNKCKIL